MQREGTTGPSNDSHCCLCWHCSSVRLRATAATRRARARGKDPSAALRRFEDDLPSLEGDSEGVLHYVDLVEKAGIDAYKIFSEVTLPRLHFAKGYRDYWLREFARPETDRFVRDCFWWAFATKNRARGGERHATLAIEQVLFERVSRELRCATTLETLGPSPPYHVGISAICVVQRRISAYSPGWLKRAWSVRTSYMLSSSNLCRISCLICLLRPTQEALRRWATLCSRARCTPWSTDC